MDNRTAILVLSHHPKIGARSLQKIRSCGQASEIIALSKNDLAALPLPEMVQQAITQSRQINLDQIQKNLRTRQISYCLYGDQDYPLLLKELPDPPGIFFYKGSLVPLESPCVALVGSRKSSKYGLDMAKKLAEDLAVAGVTIVSGLALGIDGEAHRATLQGHGKTVAVLGNGLNTIYPMTHYRLAQEIIESDGCVLSEFAPETPSFPSNFPIRNRIIAGLSQVTVVVEANKKSGSLLTARAALDYNREVMAIPHSLYNPGGEGPNQLIKMGAALITDAHDVLDLLGLDYQSNPTASIKADSKEEEMILQLLSKDPMHIDQVILQTGLSASVINATMILMEMKKIIRHTGSNTYIKAF